MLPQQTAGQEYRGGHILNKQPKIEDFDIYYSLKITNHDQTKNLFFAVCLNSRRNNCSGTEGKTYIQAQPDRISSG